MAHERCARPWGFSPQHVVQHVDPHPHGSEGSPVTWGRALLTKTSGRHVWDESQRVPIVDLPQHVVGESNAVELPEGVVVPVVVEVLVLGFENAPVIRVLRGLERVLPEQDAVPVLLKESDLTP